MAPFMTWLFQFLFCFLQYQVAASSSSPLSSFASSAHSLCRRDQRNALLQFKHVFTIDSDASSKCHDYGIPSYPKTLSWDENTTDCCDWDGVTCDGLTSHVIGLDLSCSQLYGKIHSKSSLFQLSHLQRLNLAFNDFKSSRISYAFGSFASLTHLNLSDSGFSGSIPSEISHLSKLISLYLSYSRLRLKLLHFKVLLKNLTRLQELVLFEVDISSGLPDSLTNLSSLTTLALARNGLRGHLPDSVFHLPNLQWLVLHGNNDLDINLPKSTWHSGSSLRGLDLSYTNCSGELPDSIGYLKSLNYLLLAGCKLQGSIPNSIGNLMQIRALDLSECKLQGSIPNSIGNLTQIRALVLSDNNFYSEVPSTLSNLKNLTLLRLDSNNFTGPIPFNLSGLQNLEVLHLDRNSLSGVIPPSLFTLSSLKYLDLSSNHLTGPIPEFQHLLQLLTIDLSDNKLCGPIPKSISTLVNLYWLSVASNDLSGVVEIPILNNIEYPTLFNTNLSVVARSHVNNTLPNLEYVFMSSCNIEVFPYFLRAAENLIYLDLSHNRIHGEVPKWVGFIGKASLARLNLSHNFLTNMQLPWERLDFLDLRSNLLQGPLPIPPPLTRYFFISNNSLSGEIPSSICNAISLHILDFSHNKLSGTIPQCLRNFSNDLLVLNLRSNGFKGTLPLAFAKPNQLRSLDLNGNQFEGPIPRSLANCTSLEVLDVGNNKINDTFPYWLDSLPKLQVLVIRYNRFHGPINTSKSKFFFPKLRIIDVSYNEFSGHLPTRYFNYFKAMKNKTMPGKKYMSDEESYYHDSVTVTIKGLDIEMLRILTIFTTIDFSSNNFSGEIPNVIGKLNSLIVLNISHNSLTGYIPESLGNLTSLESLDISSNKLTGRIPSQLASLTFLEVLNLSWNCLHGRIPQGPQFNTFQNGSYAGNLGLCGFPLSKECENNNRTKVEPPVLQQEEDDPIFDGFFWKIVVIGYGCGMTLGIFLGSLMFLIGRPKFFVRLAEKEMPRKVTRLRTMVTDTVARRK